MHASSVQFSNFRLVQCCCHQKINKLKLASPSVILKWLHTDASTNGIVEIVWKWLGSEIDLFLGATSPTHKHNHRHCKTCNGHAWLIGAWQHTKDARPDKKSGAWRRCLIPLLVCNNSNALPYPPTSTCVWEMPRQPTTTTCMYGLSGRKKLDRAN